MAIGLALFTFNAWPGALTALETVYPLAVLLFFATLPAWLATRAAGHGLDPALGRPLTVGFGLALAGLVVLTGAAFVPLLPDAISTGPTTIWHIGICLVIFGATSWWTARRALRARLPESRRPQRPPTWLLDAALFASLLTLTGVHEGWAWRWIEDSQRDHGPLSIAMLPSAAAVLVWPGRFFYQLERPLSDGPRWRFIGLLATFTAYALLGGGRAP